MVITDWVKRMIKNIVNYIKGSNLVITLYFNPFNYSFWSINRLFLTKSEFDPGLLLDVSIKIPGIRVHFFIDDGSW